MSKVNLPSASDIYFLLIGQLFSFFHNLKHWEYEISYLESMPDISAHASPHPAKNMNRNNTSPLCDTSCEYWYHDIQQDDIVIVIQAKTCLWFSFLFIIWRRTVRSSLDQHEDTRVNVRHNLYGNIDFLKGLLSIIWLKSNDISFCLFYLLFSHFFYTYTLKASEHLALYQFLDKQTWN